VVVKDIMRTLAEARPAHLDAGHPDGATRERELRRAFAETSEASEPLAPPLSPPLVRPSGPPLSPADLRRRHRTRLSVAIGSTVAGVAAVAVAVAVAGHDVRPRPPKPQAKPNPMAALLAAADRAEQGTAGRFWYTDRVSSSAFLTKAGYAVTGASDERFRVIARRGLSTEDTRGLPSWPMTAADHAAWRAAGSPSRFHVWANDHYDDFSTTRSFPTGAAPLWQRSTTTNNWTFPGTPVTRRVPPNKELTVAQVQELPSDPARLGTIFFPPMEPLPPLTPETFFRTDWNQLGHMIDGAGELFTFPLPPRVRAGLMRTLAAQPGIHSFGTVTDVFGRTGIAVGVNEPDQEPRDKIGKNSKPVDDKPGAPLRPEKVGWAKAPYGSREVVIFDPKTGAYLGSERILTRPGGEYAKQRPGFVIYFDLLRASGWSDHRPSPPHALPGGSHP
jgi:hypothetical protein